MADQVNEYKCSNCGGPLRFDPASQMLVCDNCGSVYQPEEIEALYLEHSLAAAQLEPSDVSINDLQWSAEEAEHMRAYTCPSCGAQIICDENTAATSCPYCGNPTVVPAQFAGSLRPDYIIPFKYSKEQAIAKLKEFYKDKTFLPSEFSSRNHLEEIKGVYVPFWLFSGRADTDLAFTATRTHTHRTSDEYITTTEHYRILRQGSVNFDYVPADASTKMADDFMDAIEPYDFDEMVPFQMSYLPGYLADKYDVEAQDDEVRAFSRMSNSAVSTISGTVSGYSTVLPERQNVRVRRKSTDYAFLPVWMLATRYQGKPYLFAVNGQTGKMVGDDLPVDSKKVFLRFITITLILELIVLAAVWMAVHG
ncbi:MAG: hypothetical protein IKF51_03035 [Solobacterium sp.]|nr:hypothetical protein [Solobacterium sp.]